MKIIFLNTLDAQITEPLKIFLQKHLADTDVFCLQECYGRMQGILTELHLPEHFTELTASKHTLPSSELFTNLTLVRNSWEIQSSSSNAANESTGLFLFSTITKEGRVVHISNVHGLSKPGKLDNENRLQQSQEMIDAFAPLSGIKIIGGDLNVLLDTESVRLFENAGYKNLIRDFGITTTRNEISWAKYPGNELYYSDYVFTKDAEALNFEVPEEVVSDHQPMILTINL